MSLDLKHLAPAPWAVDYMDGWIPVIRDDRGAMLLVERDDDTQHLTALQFAALARNAFDVMLRRKWLIRWMDVNPAAGECSMAWGISVKVDGQPAKVFFADDPFTPLVEADQWYAEHVEMGEKK